MAKGSYSNIRNTESRAERLKALEAQQSLGTKLIQNKNLLEGPEEKIYSGPAGSLTSPGAMPEGDPVDKAYDTPDYQNQSIKSINKGKQLEKDLLEGKISNEEYNDQIKIVQSELLRQPTEVASLGGRTPEVEAELQNQIADQNKAEAIGPTFFDKDNFTQEGIKSNIASIEGATVETSGGGISAIVQKGKQINREFQPVDTNRMGAGFKLLEAAKTDPLANEAVGILTKAGLMDSGTGVIDAKLGNATALELLTTISEMLVTRDTALARKKASEYLTPEEMQSIQDSHALDVKAHEKLNPDYIQGSLIEKVLNKAVANPNIEGDTNLDYGGFGNTLTPKQKAFLDTWLWGVVNELALFKEVTTIDLNTDKEVTHYEVGQAAVDYWYSSRNILADLKDPGSDRSVSFVSLRETSGEKYSGRSAIRGDKRATIKSIQDKNTVIQDEAKGNLGGMPKRIEKEGFNYIDRAISEVITFQIRNKKPVVKTLANMPDYEYRPLMVRAPIKNQEAGKQFKDMSPEEKTSKMFPNADDANESQVPARDAQGKVIYAWQLKPQFDFRQGGTAQRTNHWYSNEPSAKLLGLDKESWIDAYNNADKNPEYSEAEVINQANLVMQMKAREVVRNKLNATYLMNKKYYDEVFHATSNGRYMFRSYIDPQTYKIFRNITGSATPIKLDLKKLSESDREVLDNWKYIVAKNLLTTNDISALGRTKGWYKKMNGDWGKTSYVVATENMGWNSVMELANKILNEGRTGASKDIYNRWVKVGRELRKLNRTPNIKMSEIEKKIRELDTATSEGSHEGLAKRLNKSDSWNFVLQSYIDIANYDDAMKPTPKERAGFRTYPESNWSFFPKNLTPRDKDPRRSELEAQLDNARNNGDEDLVNQISSDLINEFGSEQDTSYDDIVDELSLRFEPLAKTQHDGKQNGIAIQATQMGDLELMRRVGLIFTAEDNVIPEGDIRDLARDNAYNAIDAAFSGNDDKILLWRSIFKVYKDRDDQSDVFKALYKQPLMETSYGKSHRFHQETAEEFFNNEDYGRMLRELRTHSMYDGKSDSDIVEDLNDIIGQTLKLTLGGLEANQAVLKKAGKLWSMMGINIGFEGPLGDTIYMGSKETFDTGKTISVPTIRGFVEKKLTVREPTFSARSKRKWIKDEVTQQWVREDLKPYGQEVANQLPVLAVQQIDAAIMATAINRVNKGRDVPLFVIPVHDAIVTDATSVAIYHKAINKAFIDVNREYSLAGKIRDAYHKAVNDFERMLDKSNKDFNITPESKQYRAIYDYVQNEIEEHRTGNRSSDIAIFAIKNLKWEDRGATLTSQQLKQLFAKIRIDMGMEEGLNRWFVESQESKIEAFKEFNAERGSGFRVYQYN